MLPAAEELRVFEEVLQKNREWLVVAATNIAETSLTIPGIKSIVDTGREKWIRKASASQRAGKAGRTGPGHCCRLYSSVVFNYTLPDFSCAEISKVPLDSYILFLESMTMKVEKFPFPTPPNTAALEEAKDCLKNLDGKGRLTPPGMAGTAGQKFEGNYDTSNNLDQDGISGSLDGEKHDFLWSHGTIEDVEQAWRVSSSKAPLLLNVYEEKVLGKAICAGWVDKSCETNKRIFKYQTCMVDETVFFHPTSSLSRSAPELLVYSELLHAKRPYIHGATSVDPKWLVQYASSSAKPPLCSTAPAKDRRPYYKPNTNQLPLDNEPIRDDDDGRWKAFAFALLEGHALPCLKSYSNRMAARPSIILEQKRLGGSRVEDLLSIYDGYAIKAEVISELFISTSKKQTRGNGSSSRGASTHSHWWRSFSFFFLLLVAVLLLELFGYIDSGAFDECTDFLAFLDDNKYNWENEFIGWIRDPKGGKKNRTRPKLTRVFRICYFPRIITACEIGQHYVIVKINDWMFCHGRLLPQHAACGIEMINREVSQWIKGLSGRYIAISSGDGMGHSPNSVIMGHSLSCLYQEYTELQVANPTQYCYAYLTHKKKQ
ncbi:ATP-dependent RNA helicase, putative [Ricinus communis]|uniref:RNA helicase n=1 Tax=Ricinus communis TaxID=3988 RepID=B9T2X7_RICCO|nr:ATP-dependent RNA helicase, putative [Ricinus communis]